MGADGGSKLDLNLGEVGLEIGGNGKPIGIDVDIEPIQVDLGVNAITDSKIDATTNSTVNASMTGEKDKPIAAMILGDPQQPVSVNTEMGMSVKGQKDEPVAFMALGDQAQPISGHITGNKDKPIAMAMEMTNLPRFTVEDIKELTTPKMRLSFPGHQQFCFKVMGRELFSMCMGGEQQVIAQEYVPRDGEDCSIPVCDMDTRPFPESSTK